MKCACGKFDVPSGYRLHDDDMNGEFWDEFEYHGEDSCRVDSHDGAVIERGRPCRKSASRRKSSVV